MLLENKLAILYGAGGAIGGAVAREAGDRCGGREKFSRERPAA